MRKVAEKLVPAIITLAIVGFIVAVFVKSENQPASQQQKTMTTSSK